MGRQAPERASTGDVQRSIAASRGRVGSRDLTRRLLVVGLLVAPLVAGDLAVRALIAMHRLPIAAAQERALEVAWTNYERTGPADILILGDSLARMGIHPATLAGLAGGVVGRPVTAYNISTPGAGFSVYRAFVEELGREGRLPKLAVIGISTVGLQRTTQRAARVLRSPFGRLVSDCGDVRGLEGTLSCHLESVSALWRWRGQPDRLVEALADPVPRTRRDNGITLEADGYGRGRSIGPEALDVALSVALENTRPLAAARPDLRAYVDLIEAMRSRGIRGVAVLIPYAPPFEEALEAREPGWRELRSRLLERLSETAGQPILDSGPVATWWTVQDSHDVRHFSPQGGKRFTAHLWNDATFRTLVTEALGAAPSTASP
jgi:hypothetical protein